LKFVYPCLYTNLAYQRVFSSLARGTSRVNPPYILIFNTASTRLHTTEAYYSQPSLLFSSLIMRFAVKCPKLLFRSYVLIFKFIVCQKPRPEPSQAGAKPSLAALARPRFLQSRSRLRPGQSQGFWAKPGPNNTNGGTKTCRTEFCLLFRKLFCILLYYSYAFTTQNLRTVRPPVVELYLFRYKIS
jgi:hypothetical protein